MAPPKRSTSTERWTTPAWAHSIAYITPTAAIGKLREFAGGYFVGSLDEVLVSNTARSADWIKTEYNEDMSLRGSLASIPCLARTRTMSGACQQE
jgi:hypothetical protein